MHIPQHKAQNQNLDADKFGVLKSVDTPMRFFSFFRLITFAIDSDALDTFKYVICARCVPSYFLLSILSKTTNGMMHRFRRDGRSDQKSRLFVSEKRVVLSFSRFVLIVYGKLFAE